MDLDKIKQFREEEKRNKEAAAKEAADKKQAEALQSTVKGGANTTANASKQTADAIGKEVRESGQQVLQAMRASQGAVAEALNNLVLATVISKDPEVVQVAKQLADLLSEIAKASSDFKGAKLNLLPVANEKLSSSIDKLATKLTAKPEKDYTKEFQAISDQLSKLDLTPVVNVPQTDVVVDLSPIVSAIKELQKTAKAQKIDIPKVDFSGVMKGLDSVRNTIAGIEFPVPNYVLPFQNMATGKGTQANVDSDGAVLVRSSLQANSIFERVSDTGGSSAAFTTFGAVAGEKNYVRGYTITNTSASNGYVDFRDGTGGAVLWTVPIPANGGANIATDEPIFWTTAGTALAYDVSAALTTVYISITGYQA